MPSPPAPTTGVQGLAAWTREALASTTAVPGVRRAGLALVEGGGRRLLFTASDRADHGEPEWCHIDAYDDVPLTTAVRTGRPVLGALDQLGPRYAAFVERQRGTGTAAIAAVPIAAAGQTLGGFVLFFEGTQPLEGDHQRRLEELAAEVGARLREVQRTAARATLAFAEDDVPPGAAVALHTVPADPAAVAPARRFLQRTLTDWGVEDDAIDTAALCLSELVTNAVIHTAAGCAVRVVLDRGVLTTSVRDLRAQAETATGSGEEPLRVHGRGLQLVEALATRWGSTVDAGGATVWFVLDLGPAAPPPTTGPPAVPAGTGEPQ